MISLFILVELLLLRSVPGRIEKGIFCFSCDLLRLRYCREVRCDRSHFCYKTETASGCSNPYMHKISECRNMHRGDCCFAREDLHGKRFNTSECIHDIPEVMCHSCDRTGCRAVGCDEGSLCYGDRYQSGCAGTSDYEVCAKHHDRCCDGRTAFSSWNATKCQTEPQLICEDCPIQPESKLQEKLNNCTMRECSGLCYLDRREGNLGKMIETGCLENTRDIQNCTASHDSCCNLSNVTECYCNESDDDHSIDGELKTKFFATFAVIFLLMTAIFCLCFRDYSKH